MASTSTETRSREKRDAVPILLESFPVPPSFIPPSPLLSSSPGSPPLLYSPFVSPIASPGTKQPPSAPPSAPLPPVPGPSPISEHDTLMFISAARSRRSSKMSVASSSSHCSRRGSKRDSAATLASNISGSSVPSLSPSATPYDSSRSLRSYSSSSSLSVPVPRYIERSPVMQPRIAEEDDADLTRMSLDDISLTSPLPERLSDSEKVLDVAIGPSLSRSPHSEQRNSISSVEAREGPTLPEDEVPAPSPTPRLRSAPSHIQRFVDKDLPPLPPTQPPPHPSRSHSYPHPPPPQPPPPPAPSHARRSSSPDIKDILATTPKPRRTSSIGSSLRSRSASRSVRGLRRRVSEGVGERGQSTEGSGRQASAASTGTSLSHHASRRSLPRSRSRPESPSELAYERSAMAPPQVWDEDSFVSDYGIPVDETGTPYEMFDGDEEERLEKELDGNGSDSDSSLDLHTPLPHLMVRDGLLSPQSKLVQASRNNTPLPNDRPGSIFSVVSTVGSVMTKSGLFKDERDTAKRRVRHRDGRLLAGGIGLTTGLGWSDSEDEDAPSPLIRQISSNSLKKRAASSSSLRSVANSVSRSYSGHMPESRMEEFGVIPKVPRKSLPPTAWLGKSHSAHGHGDWRTSASSVSSMSSTSALSHGHSRASVTSHRSAPASTTARARGLEPPPLSMKSLGYIREGHEIGFDTPSTSSSASTPMPPTPDDIPLRGRRGSISKKVPARLDLAGAPALAPNDYIVVMSSTPSSASTSAGEPSPALSTSTASGGTPKQNVPRPLRLPQSQGALRRATDPARSTPPSVYNSTGSPAVQRASSASSTPSSLLRPKSSMKGSRSAAAARPGPGLGVGALSTSPPDGIAFPSRVPSRSPVRPLPVVRSASASASRLKPRTGTGMAYRSTGSPAVGAGPGSPAAPRSGTGTPSTARPSLLRMPSTRSLPSSNGIGVAL
ncbi:hypothetical protein BD413DRAFT_312310 [Trametes elegans]|nr:hypothetical protein BD413DRAFT_312310 [Trametes elegans]